MSDKISPVTVVKETLVLCWTRNSLAGLALVAAILYSFVLSSHVSMQMNASLSAPPTFGGYAILPWILHIVLLISLLTFSCHLAVTAQRSEGRLFPVPLLKRVGTVLVRCILIWIMALIAFVPLVVVVGLFFPEGEQLKAPIVYWFSPISLLICMALYAFFIRLGLMVPGASVGEAISISTALRMSKNYSWKMFLSFMMLIVPAMIVLIFATFIVSFMSARLSLNPMAILPVASFLLYSVMIILAVCLSVWYEKLRLRYEAQQAALATDADYGQCQD